jgi:hypothetical protein
MRDDTKLARIREAMRTGDWEVALRLAARFQRLGKQGTAIRRAAAALNNPSFYRQIGRDVDRLKAEGIIALKQRFTKSWSSAEAGRKSSGRKNGEN